MEFDASLLVIMVIFLIVYTILKVFFFRPLVAIMKRREERIGSAQEIYDRANADAEERLAEEQGKLQQARREAASRREELRREANDKRREMLEQSRVETQSELARALGELDETVAVERSRLAQQARALATKMAERLLGRAV